MFCVGRLDMATEGLILVTNDGELANGLTHPRHGVEKIYHVQVAGKMEQEVLSSSNAASTWPKVSPTSNTSGSRASQEIDDPRDGARRRPQSRGPPPACARRPQSATAQAHRRRPGTLGRSAVGRSAAAVAEGSRGASGGDCQGPPQGAAKGKPRSAADSRNPKPPGRKSVPGRRKQSRRRSASVIAWVTEPQKSSRHRCLSAACKQLRMILGPSEIEFEPRDDGSQSASR